MNMNVKTSNMAATVSLNIINEAKDLQTYVEFPTRHAMHTNLRALNIEPYRAYHTGDEIRTANGVETPHEYWALDL